MILGTIQIANSVVSIGNLLHVVHTTVFQLHVDPSKRSSTEELLINAFY